NGMCHSKGRDDFQSGSQLLRHKEQAEQEKQVVVAGEDMLHAEQQEIDEYLPGNDGSGRSVGAFHAKSERIGLRAEQFLREHFAPIILDRDELPMSQGKKRK